MSASDWYVVLMLTAGPVAFVGFFWVQSRLSSLPPDRKRVADRWLVRPLLLAWTLFWAWSILFGPHRLHLPQPWMTDVLEILVAIGLGLQLRTWLKRPETPPAET
ncbi:MAG TPA: hypothetical protein VGL66_06430 [Caulobacteraceae bacterium]|jgi:hypothetical protein